MFGVDGIRHIRKAWNELEWRIWFKCLDKDGKKYTAGVWHRGYKRKCDASRVAKRYYGDSSKYEYVVSKTNPWAFDRDVEMKGEK